MLFALIGIPFGAGLLALALPFHGPRRALLVLAALAHFGLTARAWLRPEPLMPGAWLGLDAAGLLFLGITSLLFLAVAFYTVKFFGSEDQDRRRGDEEGVFISNAPEALFTGCMLLFLAAMSLVAESRHLGLLWVALETSTLASAPMIYFHRHPRSLEATWKYLMVCSVGVALALLGNFFLAMAAGRGLDGRLFVDELVSKANLLEVPWLKAAFIFLLVGYGTKMGLAPMHTWLPDAHSEAPSPASALLSGALLNCAFLGIWRAHQVCVAAGLADFSGDLLVALGVLSLAVAGVFMLGQADYKRLLAYSSVEHMGILSIGLGLGGRGAFGALFNAVSHSLTKGMLFLVAGNILAAYKTKTASQVRGLMSVLPFSGFLWVAGFFAISGLPPFGVFYGKFYILRAALEQGRYLLAAVYLALLALVFVGMSRVALEMAQGKEGARIRERPLAVIPAAALGLLALGVGLWVPSILRDLLAAASGFSGGLP